MSDWRPRALGEFLAEIPDPETMVTCVSRSILPFGINILGVIRACTFLSFISPSAFLATASATLRNCSPSSLATLEASNA